MVEFDVVQGVVDMLDMAADFLCVVMDTGGKNLIEILLQTFNIVS